MDNDLREQVYNNLNLKETDDLLEIWQGNNTDEWDQDTFAIVKEILLARLGEVPPQSLDIQVEQVLSRVRDHVEMRDLERALSECEAAVQMAPNLASVYNERGVVYDEMGQLEQALADYQKATRLDPEFEDAWENLQYVEKSLEPAFQQSVAKQHLDQALEYGYDDEHGPALAECELARQSLPATAFAHNRFGMVLEALGELEAAIEAYIKAITLNPRFYAARDNLGNARVRLEEEYYHQVALESEAPEDEAQLVEEAEPADEEMPENLDPAPGWLYLDEKAFLLPGWPGHRTRPGRSGFDPLDREFEAAHMQGVMIRLLFTRKLRTHNPFYLLLMAGIGLMFCSPLLIGGISFLQGASLSVAVILISSPYWVVGLAILNNVYLSFQTKKPKESEENGHVFF